MRKFSLLVILLVGSFAISIAQEPASSLSPDVKYTRMITERSHKIIATLGISDSSKFFRVRQLVADQYKNLNDIYIDRDNRIALVKKSPILKDSMTSSVKSIEENIIPRLDSLHAAYITKLSRELTNEQVIAIKDGMTYGVLPITYKGYVAMIPELTAPQKEQIMKWLVEAREHAMDAESSEKKHAWFGKYKGRINNYLSSAGYDLKKAGEDWEKRRNAAKTVSGN